MTRVEGTERFVLEEDPGSGSWAIVGGRSYRSFSVSASLDGHVPGGTVELRLPAPEDADLRELVVRGPGGDPVPRFNATSRASIPLPVVTMDGPGEQPRTRIPRRAVFGSPTAGFELLVQ